MFEKLNKRDLTAVLGHLTEALDILLNKPEEIEVNIPASGISFAECIIGHEPQETVAWDDICGKWSYNTDAYKELKDKIPSPFTIFREDESYFISFDDKRELIYKLLADDLEEGIFCFFIESCYFKLCYNPDLEGIYIVPYFNYYKRSES